MKPSYLTLSVSGLLALAFLSIPLASRSQQPSAKGQNEQEMTGSEHMDHMQHQNIPGQAAARITRIKSPEELAEDKRFSEWNHHFAGFFVLLVGLLGFIERPISARLSWVRYLWAFLFFAPGVYLIIWSDPESWPTGNQTLTYVITQNMQVLQHKLFSLILLGLGVVEFIRVRKSRTSVWLSSIFPVLAGLGALMLLFHPHASDVGMGPEAHMEMMSIQRQHVGFAVTGFGIALSKAISDVGRFRPGLMRILFALLMVVLGILLLTYTE